jgi:hypothetical protein
MPIPISKNVEGSGTDETVSTKGSPAVQACPVIESTPSPAGVAKSEPVLFNVNKIGPAPNTDQA